MMQRDRFLGALGLAGFLQAATVYGQVFVEDWQNRVIKEYSTSGVLISASLIRLPSRAGGRARWPHAGWERTPVRGRRSGRRGRRIHDLGKSGKPFARFRLNLARGHSPGR